MLVNVKLYATLRKFAPDGVEIGEAFPIEIDKATIDGVLERLRIDKEQAKIIMVNGTRITRLDYALSPNDTIVIFPPVGGG
ncbi:MAG: MoaD/ThiS family protein [Candidatus Thorarchaeota archaeon]|nr:MoaD/ThiS family protein [Candidatus Thorarchaeota archaeon]